LTSRLRHIAFLLFTVLSLCTLPVYGTDTIPLALVDTVPVPADTMAVRVDTATVVAPIPLWKPEPLRAVWLGAIVPGLGQIYNRSYWKLPIVYGGLMGCGYAIGINAEKYTALKEAYWTLYADNLNDCVSDEPTKMYIRVLPEGYTIQRMGGVSNYLSTLQKEQNTYRRYRDISILATVVVYALSLVDAYVDAQLFDYDISPDLSLNVQPVLYTDPLQADPLHHSRSAELRLAITLP